MFAGWAYLACGHSVHGLDHKSRQIERDGRKKKSNNDLYNRVSWIDASLGKVIIIPATTALQIFGTS
jgi:hypothetical protein